MFVKCDHADDECPACQHGEPHEVTEGRFPCTNDEWCDIKSCPVACVEVK